ncbi:MAG: hypothetical protein ABW000_07250 [Actinoplanes sp.]
MAKINAPDLYYCGTVSARGGAGAGQVTFRDGVAETDDPVIIGFCRAAGYQIVEDVEALPSAPEQVREGRRSSLRAQDGPHAE